MAQNWPENDNRKASRNDCNDSLQHQPLFSKIRNLNNIALTSIGSLFSGPALTKSGANSRRGEGGSEYGGRNSLHSEIQRLESDSISIWRVSSEVELGGLRGQATDEPDADLTPHQEDCNPRVKDYYTVKLPYGKQTRTTGSDSRTAEMAHTSTRFPEIKRVFRGLSRSRCGFDQNRNSNLDELVYPDRVMASAPLASTAVFPCSSSFTSSNFSPSSENQDPPLTAPSGALETPPLTPDSFNTRALPSLAPLDSLDSLLAMYQFPCRSSVSDTSNDIKDNEDGEDLLYTGPRLLEVREGKKPERCVDQNDDLECDTPELGGDSSAVADDSEEWYGLDYTLEMSSRERQPSDMRSSSVGEHSKSRESWAALHRGTIHPFFEDEDYHQWKNWHRFLDRQDEKRRHRKGYEFKARSRHLAWLYVDEIRTRDLLCWQKEVFGVVARDVKERLQYIVERRSDPFRQTRKYNCNTRYLKRSRSLACLRELKARESISGVVN